MGRSISDLLPSHVWLLEAHREQLVELLRIAAEQGVGPEGVAFVVGDARGRLARRVLDESWGFVVLERRWLSL